MLTKTEDLYVIEYGERNEFIGKLKLSFCGPTVESTVGNPFVAERFNNKEHVDRIVDMLQYQGKNKARKYVKTIKMTATYEVEDAG